MSAYPPDISGAALCYVDGGHRWNGTSTCAECGDRLRCLCGQFVREDALDSHRCPSIPPCPLGCESPEDCERNAVCAHPLAPEEADRD